jgi:hypothetical protein
MSKEAMKLALEGKSLYDITGSITDIDKCIIHRFDLIQALAALAKQEQGEPWGACVSGRVFVGALPEHVRKLSEDEGLPIQWLYTKPPQRTWVGLTNDEFLDVWYNSGKLEPFTIKKNIEAKLKEKNT